MNRVIYYGLFIITLYIPFEEFIEKWLPQNLIYDLARYGPEIILLCLFILVIVKRIFTTGYFFKTPIFLPFTAFIVVAIFSTLYNQTPLYIAVLGLRPIIRYWLLFFILSQVNFPSYRYKRLLGVMFSSAIVVALIGLSQTLIGEPLTELLIPTNVTVGETVVRAGLRHVVAPRTFIFSTLGRYDTLGLFISIYILSAFGIFLYTKSDLKYRSLLILLIGLPVLLLTYSRQSWLGTLLGIMVILFLARTRRVWSFRLLALLIVIIIAFTIVFLIPNARYLGTFASVDASIVERLLEPFSTRYLQVSRNNYGRLFVIFGVGKSLLEISPWVGLGPGEFGSITAQFFGYDFATIVNVPQNAANLINDVNWITLLGQVGILGVLAFISIWVSLAIFSWKVVRKSILPLTKGLALGCIGLIILFLVSGFFGPNFEVRQVSFYVWGFTGLLFGLYQRERQVRMSRIVHAREETKVPSNQANTEVLSVSGKTAL